MSICQKIWDGLGVSVSVHCSFASAYCGCMFLRECTLFARVFSLPTVDWLDRMLLGRCRCVFGHITLTVCVCVCVLFANKATWCLPSKHEPRMMKLCALPNCKASFTPWYLLSSALPLTVALLSRSLPPGCSRLTLYYRLSHPKPVISPSNPTDFTTLFVVINQSTAAREGEKPLKLSKQWPSKVVHLQVGTESMVY